MAGNNARKLKKSWKKRLTTIVRWKNKRNRCPLKDKSFSSELKTNLNHVKKRQR